LPQNLDIKEIKYNLNLSRIFVYTTDSVFSTWFGKELQNFDIVTYPSTKWIENQNCQPEMEGNIQICKDSNRVYFYDSSN
jgi:hypothetical protein